MTKKKTTTRKPRENTHESLTLRLSEARQHVTALEAEFDAFRTREDVFRDCLRLAESLVKSAEALDSYSMERPNENEIERLSKARRRINDILGDAESYWYRSESCSDEY